MKQNICIKMTLCILLVLAISPVCIGQTYAPQPFSADFHATSPNGNNVAGKYYFSPPNFRMDMNIQGRNVSSITNATTQTVYMVMHDQHMYMEMHNDQANPFMRNAPGLPNDFDPNNPCVWEKKQGNTCHKVGTETVNGRLCDKYAGVSKDGKTTGTGWIDQKLHFPIKLVSSDGNDMEFTNIREGRPDASLFQPPSGYRKMDMPGMMGARPPQ